MPLCQITEYNDDAGCHDLCNNGIYLKILYEYLQQNIIEQKIKHADHKVPEQLNSPLYHRIIKYHVFRKEEAYRECYKK